MKTAERYGFGAASCVSATAPPPLEDLVLMVASDDERPCAAHDVEHSE
jgi:hypothetical protein